MTRHNQMRKCLKKWMSDMDLYSAMKFYYDYSASPTTLSRERRNVGGLEERSVPNKHGVMFKQFKWSN